MRNKTLDDPELQEIALACLDYGKSQAVPQPVVCFSWVARLYEGRFGRTFHQSRLGELERLGILSKEGDTSRGGHRRYYRILDPARLAKLLTSLNLN